jgi:hypothetical protein
MEARYSAPAAMVPSQQASKQVSAPLQIFRIQESGIEKKSDRQHCAVFYYDRVENLVENQSETPSADNVRAAANPATQHFPQLPLFSASLRVDQLPCETVCCGCVFSWAAFCNHQR